MAGKFKKILIVFLCLLLCSFNKISSIEKITNYLSNVKSFSSEFTQINANGDVNSGVIYIEKPGKLRIEYKDPNPNLIISDNRKLAHINKKVPYINIYKISELPIKMLISEDFLIEDYEILDYQNSNSIIEIELGEKKKKGKESLRIIFEEKPLILKKWIIKDQSGLKTEIFLKNLSLNIDINQKIFQIIDPSKVPFGKKVN